MIARRGSVLVVVIWSVALAALVVTSLQVSGYRQAVLGREALARVQARWAARAGVETMISLLDYDTENPEPNNPLLIITEMEDWSSESMETGSWDISHVVDGVAYGGPLDEHSRMNINLVDTAMLSEVDGMMSDVVDAIIDWRDTNHEEGMVGAESDFYLNRNMGYGPRNGNFRSMAELELVAGAYPTDVRGEDWDLDNRLDMNEDDGEVSWPEDAPDGTLTYGWSGIFTATSRDSGLGPDRKPRIHLKRTSIAELREAIPSLSTEQAGGLMAFARTNNARLETLVLVPLSQAVTGATTPTQTESTNRGRTGRSSSGTSAANSIVPDLTPDQLRDVFRFCTLTDFDRPTPGRININTVGREVLVQLFGLSYKTADNLISRQQARREGFSSILDLLEVSGIDQQWLGTYGRYLDVVSNVYTISCIGTSANGLASTELVVTVDRSTFPARIISYREQ